MKPTEKEKIASQLEWAVKKIETDKILMGLYREALKEKEEEIARLTKEAKALRRHFEAGQETIGVLIEEIKEEGNGYTHQIVKDKITF